MVHCHVSVTLNLLIAQINSYPLNISAHCEFHLELRRPLIQFPPEHVDVGAFNDEIFEFSDTFDV